MLGSLFNSNCWFVLHFDNFPSQSNVEGWGDFGVTFLVVDVLGVHKHEEAWALYWGTLGQLKKDYYSHLG